MKRILTILTLVALSATSFAQKRQALVELRYTMDTVERTERLQSACDKSLGAIVINCRMKDLRFNITNMSGALRSVTYEENKNRYILCVPPTGGNDLNAAKFYTLEITAEGCKRLQIDIDNVQPSTHGTKYYTVTPYYPGWIESEHMFTMGAFGGANLSAIISDHDNFTTSMSPLIAPSVGLFADWKFVDNASFQTSVSYLSIGAHGEGINNTGNYEYNGTTINGVNTYTTMRIEYLRTSLNVVLNRYLNDHWTLFLGGGINFDYALKATCEQWAITSDYSITWASTQYDLLDYDRKYFDNVDKFSTSFGVMAGIQYRRYFMRLDVDLYHKNIGHWANDKETVEAYPNTHIPEFIPKNIRLTLGFKF